MNVLHPLNHPRLPRNLLHSLAQEDQALLCLQVLGMFPIPLLVHCPLPQCGPEEGQT